MSKGKSALTGGSGDVNPQWYKLAGVTSTAVQTPISGTVVASMQVPNPVSRLKQTGNKTMVLEILKVRWNVDIIQLVNDSLGSYNFIGFILTSGGGSPSSTQGRCIDYIDHNFRLAFPVSAVDGTTGEIYSASFFDEGPDAYPITHDLTDGAGHGILVATDQITLWGQATVADLSIGLSGFPNAAYSGTPTLGGWNITPEILYRFKEISDKEWIGIVQSQQNNS